MKRANEFQSVRYRPDIRSRKIVIGPTDDYERCLAESTATRFGKSTAVGRILVPYFGESALEIIETIGAKFTDTFVGDYMKPHLQMGQPPTFLFFQLKPKRRSYGLSLDQQRALIRGPERLPSLAEALCCYAYAASHCRNRLPRTFSIRCGVEILPYCIPVLSLLGGRFCVDYEMHPFDRQDLAITTVV